MKKYFRNVKLFLLYRKTLKSIQKDLEATFNLRIDMASRMYTVLNIPDDQIDSSYNLSTAYIDVVVNKNITAYSNKLATYLNSKGLGELYEFYNIERIGKYNYLLVIGFKLFKSHEFIKNTAITSTIFILILIIFKLFIH